MESVLKTLGKYEIIGELGCGAMGVVYRARDPIINRLVAPKRLPRLAQTTKICLSVFIAKRNLLVACSTLISSPSLIWAMKLACPTSPWN